MKGLRGLFATAPVIFMALGCQPDIYAEVESTTAWKAYLDGYAIEASGDFVIDLPDSQEVCITVQKLTEPGSLTVRVVRRAIVNPGVQDEKTTTEPYGMVQACGSGRWF